MAMVDSSGAFTDADMQDVEPTAKVESNTGGGDPERTLRSARRVFVLNLPYELDWFELKDFFKPATKDTSECFVDIFNHPVSRKAMGAGFVEFRSVPEMDAALAMNGQNFKGRRVKIIHDPENEHLTRFADKQGLTFKMDQRYKPKFMEMRGGGGGDRRGNDRRDDRSDDRRDDRRGDRRGDDRDHRRNDGGPQDRFNDRQASLPPPQFSGGPPPMGPPMGGCPPPSGPPVINDPFGRPLISDVENLLATSVFYSNLPWRAGREEIERMFSTCGPIKRLDMLYEDENHDDEKKRGKFRGMGICEFTRARDAQRSLIMINGTQMGDRMVSVRPARDQRELPANLSDLGRPIPEKDCADRVVQEYNFDPFAKNTLFCMNLPFDCHSDEVREIFEMVGDVIDCRLIKKDGKSKGTCVLDLTTATDAQQCVNVLHDSIFMGRKMVVRFDKSLTEPARQGRDNFGPPLMSQPQPNFHAPPAAAPSRAPPAHYGAPPAAAPPAQNKDDQVKALASLLGLNEATVSALKILQEQGGNATEAAAKLTARPDPPKRENYQSRQNDRSNDRRDNYRNDRNSRNNERGNGRENGRDRSPSKTGNYNQTYQQTNHQQTPSAPQNSNNHSSGYANQNSNQNSNNYGYNSTKQETNANMASLTGGNGNNIPKPAPAPAPTPAPASASSNANASNNQAWNPVTKDTVYVRNLPETMTENRLRSMLNSQGQISFMDFPCKHDNTPVGYAYVRFSGANCLECCNRTIAQYDSYVVDGCKLEVGLY